MAPFVLKGEILMDEKELEKDLKKDSLPIFKSSENIGNMKKDRFVVPQATSFKICKDFKLKEESQKETVNKLVDRTPQWLDLSSEEQTEEIKAALVLQTVAEFLYAKRYISDKCSMYENGFDKDGNIILDAFYIKDSKVQQQLKQKYKNKRTEKENKVSPISSFSEYKKRKEGKK